VPVTLGTHSLNGTTPFGIFVYGFARDDGYGYSGGLHLGMLSNASISVAPQQLARTTGSNACLVASAVDINGSRLGGIGLDFLVTGVNAASAHVDTDGNGQASFCYTGTAVGADTVAVSTGRLSASAPVAWSNDGNNQAPFVDAGAAQTITLPQAATLAGIVSDDGLPLGALTVQWTVVSGPGTVTFSNAAAAATTATFTVAGSYALRLSANDGAQLATADTTVTVVSATPNQAPTLVAIPDQTVDFTANPSGVLDLHAIASDDGFPAGSKLSYSWSYVSGAGSQYVLFDNPVGPDTKAIVRSNGWNATHILRVTIDDSQKTASTDVRVTVIPANQAPRVDAGPDITLPTPTTTNLKGTVSDDGLPVSSTLQIEWRQLQGPATVTFADKTLPTTAATFPVAGYYYLQLSASDGEFTSTSNGSIIVNGGNPPPSSNKPPVVSTPYSISITLPQDTTDLPATVTDDGLPYGTLFYNWIQTGGPAKAKLATPDKSTTKVTVPVAGDYYFRIITSDGQLSTTSNNIWLIVNAPVPPLPVVSIQTPVSDDLVTKPVDVVGSVSAGSWVLEYSLATAGGAGQTWVQFGSGSGQVISSKLATFDPTILMNGAYSIRLTSTDRGNQTSSITTTVTVGGNMKVGPLTLAFVDLTIPLPGLPIQIIRSYNSMDQQIGDFGFGWRLALNSVRVQKNRPLGQKWEETTTSAVGQPSYSCLQSVGPRMVIITFVDGRQYRFQATSNPECSIAVIEAPHIRFVELLRSPETQGATLRALDDAPLLDGAVPGVVNLLDYNQNPYDPTQFELTTAEGYVYVIDQTLGVTQMRDANGNTLTITANGITSSNGQSVVFTRDTKNHINQITDANNNSLEYGYTDDKLTSFTNAEGKPNTFAYGVTARGDGTKQATVLTDIYDARNIHVLHAAYNYVSGRVTSITDASSIPISYQHDVAGRTETITDRSGKNTVYQYDDFGNILQVKDPLGHITSYTYDIDGNKLTETNPLLKTSNYTYDAYGNRLTETDPLGHTTRYTYNARRQVLTTTDSLGRMTINTYDGKGNLLTTTDANGKTTSYKYYPDGKLQTVTDALNHPTSFIYDAKGNVWTQTDALGHVTTYGYDGNNNKTSQMVKRTRADGVVEELTTHYDYDKMNRLLKTTMPDGSFTQIDYNSIGKQSATYDGLHQKTSYDYDNNGRLKTTTYFDGTVETTETTTYDNNDRRLTFTDRGNHTTTYKYDDAGRLTRTTYADNSYTETGYNDAGQVISSRDANGNVTTYGYDDAGRRTTVTDANNKTTTFVYDYAGQQTAVTDARNNTVEYLYDLAGRRTAIIYPNSNINCAQTGGACPERSEWDDLGRMISKTDQAGKKTEYGYDNIGRLTSVTQYLGTTPLVTSYGYDEPGNRVSQTDANQHTTKYAYDQLGRRVGRTLPVGMSESYTYDNAGNLKTRKDFNGRTTTYAYDNVNRLQSKTPDAYFVQNGLGASQVSYTYTATGKRKTMTDASGTTTYVYDPVTDRLTSKQTPSGTLSYTYDSAGNVLSIRSSNANGAAMTYTYDKLNRLATVSAPGSAGGPNLTTTYSYDEVGNLSGYTYPNGVTTGYTYDTLNRLTQVSAGPGSAGVLTRGSNLVAQYTYELGKSGNRLSVAELSGRTVTYGYDALYRLTSETVSAATGGTFTCGDSNERCGAVGYTYDAVGNRRERTSTLNKIPPTGLLYYDANDRTSTDVYDNNGNTVSSGGIENAYDFENHLIKHGDVTVVYDGDGNRVAETVGGVTTQYLVATENPTGYAQVIEELQGGKVARTYTWGLSLIAQDLRIGPEDAPVWQLSYYGFDGHGSVRFLTDPTGAVTDTYDYDAFGNLVNQTGTTPNNYLFAGEQYDPVLGLYCNRARYLDVRTGRFWGMDTWEGDRGSPLQLHKYTYVSGNPVNCADRSGHLLEGLISAAAQFALRTMAVMAVHMVIETLINMANSRAADDSSITEDGTIRAVTTGFLKGKLGEINISNPTGLVDLAAKAAYGRFMTGGLPRDGIIFISGRDGVMAVSPSTARLVTVYRAVDEVGDVIYVGITNDVERREREQFRNNGLEVEPIEGLENLDRQSARDVEQALIQYYGLGKDEGALINKINSISKDNPDYAARVNHGLALLHGAGYPLDGSDE
jgi:RHS repeat-associated protein